MSSRGSCHSMGSETRLGLSPTPGKKYLAPVLFPHTAPSYPESKTPLVNPFLPKTRSKNPDLLRFFLANSFFFFHQHTILQLFDDTLSSKCFLLMCSRPALTPDPALLCRAAPIMFSCFRTKPQRMNNGWNPAGSWLEENCLQPSPLESHFQFHSAPESTCSALGSQL